MANWLPSLGKKKKPSTASNTLGAKTASGISNAMRYMSPLSWALMPKSKVDEKTGKVVPSKSSLLLKVKDGKMTGLNNPMDSIGNWFQKGFAKIGMYVVGIIAIIIILVIVMTYLHIPLPKMGG